MQSYFTPEELAQLLKIETEDLMALITQGKLQAIRIGNNIRIPERGVENLQATCAAVPTAKEPTHDQPRLEAQTLSSDTRLCPTRTGRATFKVSGSVATGAKIWPGKMRYPINFPKAFMDKMLENFRIGEFPIGGKFDDPVPGSLGEFIQQELRIKLNPAVYLAALLIDEGYAEDTRRGYIRLCQNPISPRSPLAQPK